MRLGRSERLGHGIGPVPGDGPATGAGSSAPRVQRYTVIAQAAQGPDNWNAGRTLRVADTGLTATGQGETKVCYAQAPLIARANEILTAKSSGLVIAADPGDTLRGPSPNDGTLHTLQRVVPTIACSSGGAGDNQTFYADCGRSSRQVMGNRGGAPLYEGADPRGVYKDGDVERETPTSTATPETFRDEMLEASGLGGPAATVNERRDAYLNLSGEEKNTFDREHGINKYAAPGIGEAFVSARDRRVNNLAGNRGFNFHWGGVIMVSGDDRVTFENYARPGTNYDTKNARWYFNTFGPPTKAGQTFHEQNAGDVGGIHSGRNATFAATNANYAAMAQALGTATLLELVEGDPRVPRRAAFINELRTRDYRAVAPADLVTGLLPAVRAARDREGLSDMERTAIRERMMAGLEDHDYGPMSTPDLLHLFADVEAADGVVLGPDGGVVKAAINARLANRSIDVTVRLKNNLGFLAKGDHYVVVSGPNDRAQGTVAGYAQTGDIHSDTITLGQFLPIGPGLTVRLYKKKLLGRDTEVKHVFCDLLTDDMIDDAHRDFTITISHH